jgi:LacI family transcriptional regulator
MLSSWERSQGGSLNLTLEEIGRRAGVSRSTVSRVINDHESVRPAVRDRVKTVIEQTGYRPHAAARSLASNRTGIIGLVIPHRVHTLFDDPYFPNLIQGVSQVCNAEEATFALFIFQDESEEQAVYPRVVASRRVDGVIVTATRMGDPFLERLRDDHLPFVVVGRPDDTDGISYVDADNVGGARAAARHLCDDGYRRIAYIGAPSNTTAGLDRRIGFFEGIAACGRSVPRELVREGDYTERSGYAAMRSLLPQRPEAVFVASDAMAVGALRALHEARLVVPDDVAVVAFDGFLASERSVPPLTTVAQPVTETGARAAALLLDLVDGDAVNPQQVVMPTELIIRDSCGPAGGSAHRPENRTND